MVRRFALMVAAAALSAGSVAPAKVLPGPSVEPGAATLLANEPLVTTPLKSEALTQPEVAGSEEPSPVQPEASSGLDSEPAIVRGASLSETVTKLRGSNPGSREKECLAAGIYFESKGEPLAGQLAVGQVIANRANSRGRFPSTYCGVLTQRGQFSFVRGGSWPAVNRNSLAWRNAVAIARIVDADLHDSVASRALFFHARRVSPGWRKTRVAMIGNHVFYR